MKEEVLAEEDILSADTSGKDMFSSLDDFEDDTVPAEPVIRRSSSFSRARITGDRDLSPMSHSQTPRTTIETKSILDWSYENPEGRSREFSGVPENDKPTSSRRERRTGQRLRSGCKGAPLRSDKRPQRSKTTEVLMNPKAEIPIKDFETTHPGMERRTGSHPRSKTTRKE